MNFQLTQLQKIYLNSQFGLGQMNLNPFTDLFFTKKWIWPEGYSPPKKPLFKKKQQKSDTLKQKIINWYYILNEHLILSYIIQDDVTYIYEHLILILGKKKCLTIQNKNILLNLKKLLKCFQQKQLYCISSGQSIKDFQIEFDNLQNDKMFMQLLKKMKLIILSEPFLYFQNNFSMQFCNKLINWMDQISNYKIFEFQITNKYSEQIQENLLWFNSNSFQKVQSIFVNQIQKSILKQYLNKGTKSKVQYWRELKQFYFCENGIDCVNNSKAYDSIKGSEKKLNQSNFVYQFEMLWDLSSELISHKIQDIKLIQQRFQAQKERKQLKMPVFQQKKKKKKNKKKKTTNQIKIQCQNESISLQMDNQKVLTNSQQQRTQKQLNNPNFEHVIQQSVHLNSNQDNKLQESKSDIFSDQISHISKCQTQLHQTDVTIQKYFENQLESQEKQEYSFQEKSQFDLSKFQDEREKNETLVCINSKKNKKQSCRQKKQKQIFQIVSENLKNSSITEFIDEISIESNNLYNFKLTAYQNIVFFISTILPTTSITLFGSNAVGLALASSDIDIMMSSIKWNTLQQARQVLFFVGSQISKMGWVIDFRLILNAKVPVLKLFIDPKIDYFSVSQLKYGTKANLLESIIIKADIIINIDGQTNIGCQSTILMKQSIGKYPQLQRIILFFKYILWYYGYNQNYKGGICSYCIFLMIMSYIQNKLTGKQIQMLKLQEDCQGKIIMKILYFYAYDFNQQQDLISLKEILDINQCNKNYINNCQSSPSKRAKILKIIDPINGEFIQSSFSKFQQIRDLFKLMTKQLQNQRKKLKESLLQNKHLIEQFISSSINIKNDETKYKKLIKKIINKVVKTEIKFNIKKIVKVGVKKGIDQNMMNF